MSSRLEELGLYPLRLKVNGKSLTLEVRPHHALSRVLREQVGLTGTKECCEEGECGACTVLLEGRPVNSCLILAVEADGAEITTIEGLAEGRDLHPLQASFVEEGAVQCGYCTPGMIMAAAALLRVHPRPTEAQVRDALAGNLCRCGAYGAILRAVIRAREETSAPSRGGTSPSSI